MKLVKFDKVCMYVHVVSQSETNSRCCFVPQPLGFLDWSVVDVLTKQKATPVDG